ncbi:MAG: helix-turn-helix domain-containing protein [Myxococcota bacterium]
MANGEPDKLMTTQEAAKLLGVGPSSVKRWADDGRLPTIKTPGGHRRFRARDVESLRDDLDPALHESSNSDEERNAELHFRLPHMSREQIDALDVGVIQLDDAGFVRLYNLAESGFAGIPVDEAEGQHFFGELAPCTKNRIIYGRFKEGVRSNQLDFRILYTFTYRMRPTNVELHLYRDSETRTNWILVDPGVTPSVQA